MSSGGFLKEQWHVSATRAQVYPTCTLSVMPIFNTSIEISHTKQAQGREGGHKVHAHLIYILNSTAISLQLIAYLLGISN